MKWTRKTIDCLCHVELFPWQIVNKNLRAMAAPAAGTFGFKPNDKTEAAAHKICSAATSHVNPWKENAMASCCWLKFYLVIVVLGIIEYWPKKNRHHQIVISSSLSPNGCFFPPFSAMCHISEIFPRNFSNSSGICLFEAQRTSIIYISQKEKSIENKEFQKPLMCFLASYRSSHVLLVYSVTLHNEAYIRRALDFEPLEESPPLPFIMCVEMASYWPAHCPGSLTASVTDSGFFFHYRWKRLAVMAAAPCPPGWRIWVWTSTCTTSWPAATAVWTVWKTCGSWRSSMWVAVTYTGHEKHQRVKLVVKCVKGSQFDSSNNEGEYADTRK